MRVLPPAAIKLAAKKAEEDKKEAAADDEEEKKPTLQKVQKVQIRVNTCKANVEKETKAFEGAKLTAVKRAKARQEMLKVKTTFGKYNKAKDGLLARRDIAAYAKGEYKFTMPEDALDMIFRAAV